MDSELYDVVRAEAIKEFAERLKTMADGYTFWGDGVMYQMVNTDDIDDLVEEMTEQRKEYEEK